MSEKVILILADGMRPDAVKECGEKRFEELYYKGSYSFNAKTMFPSVTLPCHISLFHSVPPERHGTVTNIYAPQVKPVDGLVEVLGRAGKKTAMFYCWEQLRDICRPGNGLEFAWFQSYNDHKDLDADVMATDAMFEHFRSYIPDLTFLYLGMTDETGHKYGWMSKEYLDCVAGVYRCVKRVMDYVDDSFSVILTADHGGHGRHHGENIPEDMTIPMLFCGPRFEAGKELEDLTILDIAPTIAGLLGVPASDDWEGISRISGT